ncbi:AAA family ATPase, partial [Frankia sp. AgKG'84/4]|uniref:ATP-binding protein n=1 Tax=Frankia sp. AgKG'84/4 TaxID=573490 RepID=UPI00202A1C22
MTVAPMTGPTSRRGVRRFHVGAPPTRLYPVRVELLERDREVDAVRAAIDQAAAGQGSGVAVTGEPGAGKSALLAAARA